MEKMGSPHMANMILISLHDHHFFFLRMSQALNDHIWTQLGLDYIVKQIYDKHKKIWWDKINMGRTMMKDDFIRQQDIMY
jgi:hypothetical protein